MDVRFLGATDTVTGSRTLCQAGRSGARVLVDCGLFQGLKVHRLRNWERFPVDPRSLDAVVLTHAHIDHSGYLPALVRDGFDGRIYCTSATADLLQILLPDAGHLQEEEARYRNRTGTTRHAPALPLYTAEDGRRVLAHLSEIPFGAEGGGTEVAPGVHASFVHAGHLLGAASVLIDDGEARALFSGDVGRPHDLLMRPPALAPAADLVVLESTYGDRLHPPSDPPQELADAVNVATERGGTTVVPAFAVGRVQLLLHLLAELQDAGRIPRIPVFVDSPMATDATRIYAAHLDECVLTEAQCARMCRDVQFVRTPEASQALDAADGPHAGPKIIVSASGMAAGGRVVHHLKAFVGDRRNLVLLTGFQAPGTRGEALLHGATEIRIHGLDHPVAAEVRYVRGLSGHADRDELLAWVDALPRPPAAIAVVHGEPIAQDHLRRALAARTTARIGVPRFGDVVDAKTGTPRATSLGGREP